MAENTKYDILLNELSTMESQVLVLSNKVKDLSRRNRELDEQTGKLKKENFELLQKISRLEEEIEKFQNIKEAKIVEESQAGLFNSLNPKERENLKIKLQNLISRLDYHISS